MESMSGKESTTFTESRYYTFVVGRSVVRRAFSPSTACCSNNRRRYRGRSSLLRRRSSLLAWAEPTRLSCAPSQNCARRKREREKQQVAERRPTDRRTDGRTTSSGRKDDVESVVGRWTDERRGEEKGEEERPTTNRRGPFVRSPFEVGRKAPLFFSSFFRPTVRPFVRRSVPTWNRPLSVGIIIIPTISQHSFPGDRREKTSAVSPSVVPLHFEFRPHKVKAKWPTRATQIIANGTRITPING